MHHLRRLIYGLALVLLCGAVPAFGACVDSPSGQMTCSLGFAVPDQNPTRANFTTTYGNNGALTPDPTCADTLAGGWGIEDVNEGATPHFVQCVNQAPAQDLTNPTYLFGTNTEVMGVVWHNTAGATTYIELLPDATARPDEGSVATTGTLAWAIAQFTGAPHIRLAKGSYYAATTTTLTSVKGAEILGAGPGNTVIYWGNTTARDPFMILRDVELPTIGGFTLKGTAATSDCSATGCQLWDGFVVMNAAGLTAQVAQHPHFVDLSISGNTTGLNGSGFLFVAPNSDACTGDRAPWWICTAADRFASAAGVCCTTVGGSGCNVGETCDADNGVGGASAACNATRTKCVMGIDGNNDFAQFDRVYVQNGMRNSDCTANGVPSVCCTGDHAGTCGAVGWKVDSASTQSVMHVMRDCHFGHLRYGVYANSFSWYDGGWSASSGADFYLYDPQRPVLIHGGDSEGSQALFNTAGPSGAQQPIHIDGVRFATNAVIAGSACIGPGNPQECCTDSGVGATCGDIGTVKSGGPFLMENVNVTDVGTGKAARFLVNSTTSGLLYTAKNNHIKSTLADTAIFAVTHATDERWTLQDNKHRDGSGIETLIPDLQTAPSFMDPTDPSKKVTLDVSGLATGQTAVTRPSRTVCVRIENLTATDDGVEFWQPSHAALVTAVGCRCAGTCTPTLAQFQLENRAGSAMTGTPTCATTGDETFTAVSGGAATLAATDGLSFSVTNTPTAGGNYTVCAVVIGQ